MSISIGSNTIALQAQRRLDGTGGKLSESFNKLSSGYRINSGSDDAAGLAIAESLRAQSRIAGQAIRNTNDGISTLAIADGALGEVANILSRLAELASQSANGTMSVSQRSVVSNEFVALSSEIERIAAVTEFNGIKLLSGQSAITIQVGTGSDTGSRVAYVNQLATLLIHDTIFTASTYRTLRNVVGFVESSIHEIIQPVLIFRVVGAYVYTQTHGCCACVKIRDHHDVTSRIDRVNIV